MSNKIILDDGTEATVLAQANTDPLFPGMDKWAWEMLQLEKLNEEMMKLTNPEAIKYAAKLKCDERGNK